MLIIQLQEAAQGVQGQGLAEAPGAGEEQGALVIFKESRQLSGLVHVVFALPAYLSEIRDAGRDALELTRAWRGLSRGAGN